MRAGIAANRQQFIASFGPVFYGANRPGAALPRGVLRWTFDLAMQACPKAAYDCVAAFSETDFRADLKALDRPTLVLHGDDEQVVPYGPTAPLSARAIVLARLETYEGAPHGLWLTHKDRVNVDLLAWFRTGSHVSWVDADGADGRTCLLSATVRVFGHGSKDGRSSEAARKRPQGLGRSSAGAIGDG